MNGILWVCAFPALTTLTACCTTMTDGQRRVQHGSLLVPAPATTYDVTWFHAYTRHLLEHGFIHRVEAEKLALHTRHPDHRVAEWALHTIRGLIRDERHKEFDDIDLYRTLAFGVIDSLQHPVADVRLTAVNVVQSLQLLSDGQLSAELTPRLNILADEDPSGRVQRAARRTLDEYGKKINSAGSMATPGGRP